MYMAVVSDKRFRHICMASAIRAGQLKLLEDTLFMLRKPHALAVCV